MLAKYITAFIALASRVLADNVHALDPESFDTVIGDKPALVEFYAPWCGHCNNLAPVYEELGDAFSHKKDEVLIAKVDADEHRSLGSRYGVSGFPTLKWFPNGINGDPEDYSGGRDLHSLASFVTEKSGVRSLIKKVVSSVQVVTDATFEDKVLNSKKNVLVEFYAPWCGHCKNLAPIYEKVGRDFANEKNIIIAKVDATVEKVSAAKYGVSGYPTIKFFAVDGSVVEYEGGRSEQDFVHYINGRVGTRRTVGGRLSADTGRIEKLDLLAKKFAQASAAADKKAVSEEAIVLAAELQDMHASAKQYARVFEKAAVAPEFVETEAARLAKIADSGTLSAAKADDFAVRQNILAAFMVEGEEEEKEEVKSSNDKEEL
ncbi:hypothetical protein BG006_008417 [Podila minutissima]|uniref:protein disulfide-isomerase n=1 Tax=Podila minutissima TaxID=64525 RepID=A0A9P5VQI6_9FUNG|nr:hypothetical protein BG006_008417 [Podila minutissima]